MKDGINYEEQQSNSRAIGLNNLQLLVLLVSLLDILSRKLSTNFISLAANTKMFIGNFSLCYDQTQNPSVLAINYFLINKPNLLGSGLQILCYCASPKKSNFGTPIAQFILQIGVNRKQNKISIDCSVTFRNYLILFSMFFHQKNAFL